MTFEDQIRRERATMSKSFAKLADFLVDSYTEASFMTASELAHLLNLDAATVVRFAQALGYKGFPQLQQEIRQKVKNDLLIRPRQAEVSQSIPGIAASALRDLAKDLEQTRITLDTLALEQLVEQIGASRRILLISDPPAQPAAQTLAYALRQAGFLVDEASPLSVDLARLLYTASTADLLLALEVQGETPSIVNALVDARSRGIPTAALVSTASLPAARPANLVLAAHTHLSASADAFLVQILVYVLLETLRSKYALRFTEAEQASRQFISLYQERIP
jgi:DNA-binding MurR/RpiR family transcriptional regulator